MLLHIAVVRVLAFIQMLSILSIPCSGQSTARWLLHSYRSGAKLGLNANNRAIVACQKLQNQNDQESSKNG